VGEKEKVFFAANHFPEQAGSFSKARREGLPAAVPVVIEAAAGRAGFSLVGLAQMDYGTMGHSGFFHRPFVSVDGCLISARGRKGKALSKRRRSMALEIERRFLVSDPSIVAGRKGVSIRQAFLELKKEGVLRIRVAGERAFLTLKVLRTAVTRIEYEYEIPLKDGEEMFGLCDFPPMEKERYRVSFEDRVWEIDVFRGGNEGLVIAEIELEKEGDVFAVPPWAGREITGDFRYLNTHLYRHPYRSWRR